MRIHKIEVENIQSLYGTHTIDLDDILGGESLFLIHGPTGAGKSTLMDVISLALFATTPRVQRARGKVNVSESVMSRGTGSALAGVEFSKLKDGVRTQYRARWSVTRARKKPDGNMQDFERSLEWLDTDGQWKEMFSGRKKSDAARAFDEVLESFGLRDFQRSMLLAQGEFDAMLRATADERATILEHLTQTDSYSQIGGLVADLHTKINQRIEVLRSQCATQDGLSEEQVPALEAELLAVQTEQKTLVDQRAATQAALTWLLQLKRLEEALEGASQRHREVIDAQAKHAPLLADLRCFELWEPAFRALDAWNSAEEQRAESQAAHQQLLAQRPEAEAHAQASIEAAKLAEDRCSQFETLHQAILPLVEDWEKSLERAKQTARESEQASALLQRERLAEQVAQTACDQATAAQQRAVSQAALAQQALVALSGDASLVSRSADLDQEAAVLVSKQADLARQQAQSASERTRLDHEAQSLQSDKQQAVAARSQALTALQSRLQQTQIDLQTHAQGQSPDDRLVALDTEGARLQEKKTALDQVRLSMEQRDAALAAHTKHETEARSQQTIVERLEAQIEAEKLRAGELNEGIVRAQAALAPLQRITDYVAARAGLVAGEACPLCGSESHPYHDGARANEVEARAQQERAAIEQKISGLKTDLTQCEGARQQAEKDRAIASSKREAAQERCEEERTKVDTARTTLDPLLKGLALAHLGSVAEIEAEALHVVGESARVKAQKDALLEARQAYTQAKEALEADKAAFDAADAELLRRELDLAAQSQALTRRMHEVGQQLEAQNEASRAFLATLAALGVTADEVQTGWTELKARKKAWDDAERVEQKASRERDLAQSDLDKQQALLAQTLTARTQAEVQHQIRQAEADQAQHTVQSAEEALSLRLTELEAACAPLAHGFASPKAGGDGVKRSLKTHLDTLRAESTKAQSDRQGRQAELLELCTRIDVKRGEQLKLEEQVRTRQSELDQKLEDLGIADLPTLRAARLDPEVVHKLREQRDRLAQAEASARGALTQAQQARDAHQATCRESTWADLSVADLQTQVDELDAQSLPLQKRYDTTRGRLEIVRHKLEEHKNALEALKRAQEAAEPYLRLHELIGKQKGADFKKFAQALNLGQVLIHANRHLANLNHRYQLRIVKDPESQLPTLDFEVEDGWRPGTRRPLSTLSGGESFLVSLALALGLSDMRTSSMPVETLLLDEGFGTLDENTLDQALSALKALQMAGRQVGIISHVALLKEQILAQIGVVRADGEGRSKLVIPKRALALPLTPDPSRGQ